LPAMLKQNYSPSLATGTIAASGTLGQIIPPSIVLIILADQLGSAVDQAGSLRTEAYKLATGELTMPSEFGLTSTSAGEMFMGAMVPGLVLVGVYMLFILIYALIKPSVAPPVPFEGQLNRAFVVKVTLALVPPLALILMVLGSILGGVATVNQAGAIGAAGALIMAGYRLNGDHRNTYYPAIIGLLSLVLVLVLTTLFEPNIKNIKSDQDLLVLGFAFAGIFGILVAIGWSGWRVFKIDDTLRGVMIETAKTTSLVFIILLGAAMLTAAFRAFGGEELVRDYLNGLPGGFWFKFMTVMVVIFILGFFLDFIEIAVVVVPIVAPILLADPSANVTAVWLGVMIGLNMQTSFLTPPFGFALFYLRGVAPPSIKTMSMYKGVIAFIGLQILALVVVGNYPALVNYLPNRVALTSDTAPPPRNPKLQYCLEQYLIEEYASRGYQLQADIDKAGKLDFSSLPAKLEKQMNDALKASQVSFGQIVLIEKYQLDLDTLSQAYRPLHSQVSNINTQLLVLEDDIAELEKYAQQSNNVLEIEYLKEKMALLAAQIPANWEVRHAEYQGLVKQDRKARLDYRRTGSEVFETVESIRLIIDDGGLLATQRPEIILLTSAIQSFDADLAMDHIKAQQKALGKLHGTSAIKSLLSKARRALKGKNADPVKSKDLVSEAIFLLDTEIAWRQSASLVLAEGLAEYSQNISNTIGLRSLEQLPREQALYVAACNSGHRDISLNF